jgi:hypothetical protein
MISPEDLQDEFKTLSKSQLAEILEIVSTSNINEEYSELEECAELLESAHELTMAEIDKKNSEPNFSSDLKVA